VPREKLVAFTFYATGIEESSLFSKKQVYSKKHKRYLARKNVTVLNNLMFKDMAKYCNLYEVNTWKTYKGGDAQ
jgi:hypothetical protein